jgi:hypothetical protein
VKKLSKEELFEDFVRTSVQVFQNIEMVFGIVVCEEATGVNWDANENEPETIEAAKHYMRGGEGWRWLSEAYDYAFDGVLGAERPEDLVTSVADIISHLDTFNTKPSPEWANFLARGDGRFSLDNFKTVSIETLALLASVDIRTVRNAISAGELTSQKMGSNVYIDNASARNWLSGRRSFRPTQMKFVGIGRFTSISSPAEFGSFLSAQRKKLGTEIDDKKLVLFHPLIDSKAIKEIEMGMFKLPLDTVTPLSDFYQIDRKDFLVTIMKVFYGDQYRALAETLSTENSESTDDQ